MKRVLFNASGIIAVVIMLLMRADAQTTSTTATVGNVSNCSGSQLSLKETEAESDMGGKTYGNYVFTNISKSSCTLSGFPVFALLDKAGKVMRGVKVDYGNDFPGGDSDSPTGPVTLEPGQTAWFQIFYNSGMPFNLKKSPASSAQVKITAPKTGKTFVIKSEIAPYKEVMVSTIRGGQPN